MTKSYRRPSAFSMRHEPRQDSVVRGADTLDGDDLVLPDDLDQPVDHAGLFQLGRAEDLNVPGRDPDCWTSSR